MNNIVNGKMGLYRLNQAPAKLNSREKNGFGSLEVSLPASNLARPTSEQLRVYFTGTKIRTRSVIKTDSDLLSLINQDNLKSHVEILASEDFAGRSPKSEDIRKAQQYITDKFQEYGLVPLEKLTGNSYEQNASFQNVYNRKDKLSQKTGLDFDRKKLIINNVIGYIPGKNNSDEYLFVTAHYDHLGKDRNGKVYAGADDNASGVAALLEMARIISKIKPEKNVVFVATSGEELGTLGAIYLAKQLNIKGFKGKAQVLNMDSLAANGDFITIEGGGKRDNAPLRKVAVEKAKELNINYDTPPKNDRTDAEAFEKAGFPAISLLWAWMNDYENREHYHQTTDTPDIANYDNLKKSTMVALATALSLCKETTKQTRVI